LVDFETLGFFWAFFTFLVSSYFAISLFSKASEEENREWIAV